MDRREAVRAGERTRARDVEGAALEGRLGRHQSLGASGGGQREERVHGRRGAPTVLYVDNQGAVQSAEACPLARLLLALTNYGH